MDLTDAIKRRLLIGGASLGVLATAAGVTTLATQAVSAQTPPDPTTPSAVHQNNEDPAHEAAESPDREAAENNGTAFPGGKRFHDGAGSNEDPAHEASESPEREAAEHAAGGAAPSTSPSTAPSTAPAQ